MRINRIDNLKWIGILLIVLGHCGLPLGNPLTKYLFSFHVALFFIVSWFLFSEDKHTDFTKFFKNKFLRLVVPFFFFNIIFFAINKLLWEFSWTSIRDFLVGVLYGDYLGDKWGYINNTGWFNISNVSTWFLPALFVTSIYFFVINKMIQSKEMKIFSVIVISLLVYIESKFTNFRFPWGLEIGLMVMLFYAFGNIFKKQIKKFADKIDYRYILFLIIVFWIHILFVNPTNISTNDYGNYAFFLLDALLWFITFLIISKLIWENKILSFFWKNSIIILGFEWIKILIQKNIFFLSFWLLSYERSYLFWFTQFFLTILFLVPIIFIVNKFFPFILWMSYKK